MVDSIREKISHVVLPPLTMMEASNWWINNTANSSNTSRTADTGHASSKSSSNKKTSSQTAIPWK